MRCACDAQVKKCERGHLGSFLPLRSPLISYCTRTAQQLRTVCFCVIGACSAMNSGIKSYLSRKQRKFWRMKNICPFAQTGVLMRQAIDNVLVLQLFAHIFVVLVCDSRRQMPVSLLMQWRLLVSWLLLLCLIVCFCVSQ